MTVMDVLGHGLAIAGALVFAVAGIGLVTLPDPYTRISAVAKAAGIGVAFVVLGVVLMDPSWSTAAAGLLAIGLQLATSAIGGIAIGRAAVLSGHAFGEATDRSALDDLEMGDRA
ncbi:monovalent cation/H(+) antiporter subunit G [Nocardioidaceae bacterium]|nr:monovalent cation/H(+) antiporter subunit G [Nocardioidaceae bacterium]